MVAVADVALDAPGLALQPVSVTRKMAASLPELRRAAEASGLPIHHLGAGYPNPEVTDPRGFLAGERRFHEHLRAREGINDPNALPEFLREAYAYTDTLGPVGPRRSFAHVYGNDWGVAMDPDRLIPTVGASGGINLLCSLFERPGRPIGYITDAPTYAGFVARASLCQHASIYSADMDEEGPHPEAFREAIAKARADGRFVPFYYTVPDGHNPAGFSFSGDRREAILDIARQEGILIVEDAPYVYISFADEDHRPKPFFALDPARTVHLFTGSKIGLPGPRVGFAYTEARLAIDGGREAPLSDLLLTESSADILFHNPAALLSFESLLHDEECRLRDSLWPVADAKLQVYRENRAILLGGLSEGLGAWPDRFQWTRPEAGFFSVFRFLGDDVVTDDDFIARMVASHGVVVVPMYDFYPPDARTRNPRAGLDELRLSFCFTERTGNHRVQDLTAAVAAFCRAAKTEAGMQSS
ncbi:MAG: aminotransferase class I/II-fold pyridoxal phosphate-dependent enzyme [Gammaproteobacteria bacterium]|nr:aminotransferase class I/II-fold pyridoxal phosphate-dependent enzyme [Gammaproteobacteria bacterium]